MPDVAEKLKEMFEESSYTSLGELRDDIFLRLGKEYTPTAETIRQMHTPGGRASRTPDPVLLGVICSLYQKPVAAVSPDVARILRFIRQNRSLDLREHPSTWTGLYGSQDPLPFDQDVVIDLRDHRMVTPDEKEPMSLYANAS